MKSEQVTYWYLDGIREGRRSLQEHGAQLDEISLRIANIKSTIKMFASNSPAGQMLRGELDFWKNQQKRLKKNEILGAPVQVQRGSIVKSYQVDS